MTSSGRTYRCGFRLRSGNGRLVLDGGARNGEPRGPPGTPAITHPLRSHRNGPITWRSIISISAARSASAAANSFAASLAVLPFEPHTTMPPSNAATAAAIAAGSNRIAPRRVAVAFFGIQIATLPAAEPEAGFARQRSLHRATAPAIRSTRYALTAWRPSVETYLGAYGVGQRPDRAVRRRSPRPPRIWQANNRATTAMEHAGIRSTPEQRDAVVAHNEQTRQKAPS